MKLNDLRDRCHLAAINWWINVNTGQPLERNKGELICLMHSELSEAAEGERDDSRDDKLVSRAMAEVELADTLIRIFDYAGGFGYDLNRASMFFGIGDFLSLDQVFNLRSDKFDDIPIFGTKVEQVYQGGLLFIHESVSKIMELERKTQPECDIEIQIVLTIILILCHAYNCGYDLAGAFEEKLEYNRTRSDHTHEARRAEGGKKF